MSIIDNVIYEEQPSNFKSINNWKKFSSYEYQLNFRFETSGKSDFWIVGLWEVADGSRYEYLRS